MRACAEEKKRKEKTTPFGVNFMRSQVLYRAAQGFLYRTCLLHRILNSSQYNGLDMSSERSCPMAIGSLSSWSMNRRQAISKQRQAVGKQRQAVGKQRQTSDKEWQECMKGLQPTCNS